MSRIIIKNLPKYINKDRLEQLFSNYGTITDIRMIYANGNIFRRIAFIGYSNDIESQMAISKMNNTYIDTCKINVEIAKSINDECLDRPWSRYSKQSSAYKQSEKDKIERLKVIAQFKHETMPISNHNTTESNIITHDKSPKKLSKHESMIIDICGINPEDKDKFNEYMLLNNSKPITDFMNQSKIEDKNDHSICCELTIEEKDKTNICYTAKLSNLRPNITLKRLLKFFVGLDIVDIRLKPKNEKRKTCIAFADFSNENDLKKAIKLSGRSLKGNSIKIIESNNSSIKSKSNDKLKTNNDNDTINNEINLSNDILLDTGKIFVKNISYICDFQELKQLFEKFGPVVDLNMPCDSNTSKPTGYAFVTYMLAENAVTAFNHINNSIFKGRVLHLTPANSDNIDDFIATTNNNGSSYKLNKLRKLKNNASTMSYTWNSLFINQNTVANILSKRLGLRKDQLFLDPTITDNPAVSLAAGETALVNETKHFLESNGINLDSFKQVNSVKSDQILLAKNLPDDITSAQLMEFIMEKLNPNKDSNEKLQTNFVKPHIIIPPYGVTAIVKFDDPQLAKHAFKKLAFTRFRFTPLYLEWAPKDSFKTKTISNEEIVSSPPTTTTLPSKTITISGCVVFIKNLNPITSEETIKDHMQKIAQVANVTLARSKISKEQNQSLGYGFIEFYKPQDAKECIKLLQSCEIDGYMVELKLSDRMISSKVSSSIEDSKQSLGRPEDGEIPKILIKNIPFEATKKDIIELFRTYGNVKNIRLPQKLNTNNNQRLQHRGFAFAEFMTLEDAKHCFECMRYSTHLYGRRLVLEWANDSASISSIRKRTAQHFDNDGITKKSMVNRITETLDNM